MEKGACGILEVRELESSSAACNSPGRCLSWKSAQPQFDLSRSRRILPNPNPTSAFFPIFKARGLLQAETEYAADTATIFRAMQPLAKATRTYSRQTTWFTLENNQIKSMHLNRFRMRNAILLVLIKQDLRRGLNAKMLPSFNRFLATRKGAFVTCGCFLVLCPDMPTAFFPTGKSGRLG